MDSLPLAAGAFLDGGDFEAFLGSFAPHQVEARWLPELTRPPALLTEEAIEARWQARLAEAAARGVRPPYNGRLCRLAPGAARLRGGVLELAFGPTTFRERIATNLNSEVASAVGEE